MAVNVASDGQEARAVKDPITRLLDLTLGWGEFVEQDEAKHGDCVTADDIYDAYQAVAPFTESFWDAPPAAQEQIVRQFVETRLLPLLFGKAKADSA